MTTITLQTTPHQEHLITEYLKEHNTKLDELVTQMLLEKLENEADLKALQKTQAEDDGTRYTLSEVAKELGFAI
ncbi:TPA: DUF6290 family protein [Streptococcus suis]